MLVGTISQALALKRRGLARLEPCKISIPQNVFPNHTSTQLGSSNGDSCMGSCYRHSQLRHYSAKSAIGALQLKFLIWHFSNLNSELESCSGHSHLEPSHSEHRLEPHSGFLIGIPRNPRSQFPIGIQQSEVHIFDDQVARNDIGDSMRPPCKPFDLQLRNYQGAHGVVVSHIRFACGRPLVHIPMCP